MRKDLDRLIALIAKLRSPKGCPWDRKQTHVSLIPYLKGEVRELVQALRRGVPHEIEDELGDLMLQILLHSQIAKERGQFDIHDMARSQFLKLKRRHPHVFGRKKLKTARQVRARWQHVKKRERDLRDRDVRRRFRAR